ncbi:hypothetical protein TWF788_006562 [Orbilia oligospora]|uniref:Core Histone H2A/H2B/H3 domain-containing protein n=1 Tax=Orbilia oligospora TaxID=2813651 RepID=A0A7C8JY25_ORBOL|nr:hypothetical protein TWF788_006562 [Orbilia oligospora]
MARTKSAPVYKPKKKSGVAAVAGGGGVRARRWKSGTVALREIKFYQKNTGHLLPKATFARLCRELLQETDYATREGGLRVKKSTLDALQEATEVFMVKYFQTCNTFAIHRDRVTVGLKDVTLWKQIMREFCPEVSV